MSPLRETICLGINQNLNQSNVHFTLEILNILIQKHPIYFPLLEKLILKKTAAVCLNVISQYLLNLWLVKEFEI